MEPAHTEAHRSSRSSSSRSGGSLHCLSCIVGNNPGKPPHNTDLTKNVHLSVFVHLNEATLGLKYFVFIYNIPYRYI